VTRILWLRGLERANANAFERMIYIHGTPEEVRLGTPASYGCIRMRSRDVAELFETVGKGARVIVSNASAARVAAGSNGATDSSAPAEAVAQTRADSPTPVRTAVSARD
jgi:hypothetical protein